MEIIGFIILFVVVGFFIGASAKETAGAVAIILFITVIWALIFGPWAIATFIELIVGYLIGDQFSD